MSRSGADLALLLLGGFRALVDAATELADRGYEDVRPVHDFAMRAIAAGADNASSWAVACRSPSRRQRRPSPCSTSAGTWRDTDPLDARRKRLQVTPSASTCCDRVKRSSTSCATGGNDRSAPPNSRARKQPGRPGRRYPVRPEAPGWVAHSLDETT